MAERETFRILTVCTGNICRSPAAERLLAAGLGPSVSVRSAGTGALVGEPIDPGMARLLVAAGVAVDGFAARQLRPDLLGEADLVLALTRNHRSRVVDLLPTALGRSFTLLEFARLAESIDHAGIAEGLGPGDRLRAIVAEASAFRPLARAASADADDVPDPYRQGAAAFERSMALIRAAADAITRVALG